MAKKRISIKNSSKLPKASNNSVSSRRSTNAPRNNQGRNTQLAQHRNIFNDPFFTDFDDLFSFDTFHNIDNMISNVRRQAESMKNQPGTVYTKSSYRTSSSNMNGRPGHEVVNSETTTHIGPDGKKYTEKRKSYDNSNDKITKTSYTKMIGDKGKYLI